MKTRKLGLIGAVFVASVICVSGQGTVIVHDPTRESAQTKLSASSEAVFNSALPAVKQKISTETCAAEVDISGFAIGAFTKAGAKQTLVFYQYCQTGNGFGWVGLVLINGGKIVGNYISEAGWTVGINSVADINKNGRNEFTLVYSGGLHQGQGGTGVDLMEFVGDTPKGIGWYKAEEFGPTEASSVWKLTARPGPTPTFYKQKYFSGEGQNYKRVGAASVTKLSKIISNFSAVK